MKLKKRLEQYDYFHPKFYFEDVDNPKETEDSPIRKNALPIEFPLKMEDKNDILRFTMNFDGLKNSLSMSAPQIGIMKRMIMFSVPIGRKVIQTFPKTLWLNPSYEKIKDDMEEDYDVCLSVNMVVPVKRYKRIHYKAYDTKGDLVQGEAQGKAARVIQHEIDHLDGILISDHAPRERLITLQEYKQMKKDAWGGKGWQDFVDVFRKEMAELREYYPPLPRSKTKRKKQINPSKK